MAGDLELRRLDRPDARDHKQVHALVAAVAASGGAVGWLHVPDPGQVREWLDAALDRRAHVLVAERDGQVVGAGYWVRFAPVVLQVNAEIAKVMTLPAARGSGVARAVTSALVEDAQREGVEGLTLDCRGNNHAALALYASLGFVVTGRRPDWIAVGDQRFDQVLMRLDLRVRDGAAGPSLRRHGGRREGPGSS